jgi:hypothetical protein
VTSLREIQTMVRDAIFEVDQDGPALHAVSQHVVPTAHMTSADHVNIYKSAILGTLERALGNIYPVCQRLVGTEFFNGMARQYGRSVPSVSPDLAQYGDGFSQFIASFEPARSVPYLPDVATLEWHWHCAFNAADQAALDTGALAGLPESETEHIIFRLPASATLIDSEYPIHSIWQVNQPDWDGSQVVDLGDGGCRLIVWRQHYEMRIDLLNESEWRFLNGIADSIPFAALAAQTNTPDIDVLLPACVERGWIADFVLSLRDDQEKTICA